MSTEKEKEQPTLSKEDEEKEIEKKLSDLMNMGWTLLEENCPLQTCHCPLLKSLDGRGVERLAFFREKSICCKDFICCFLKTLLELIYEVEFEKYIRFTCVKGPMRSNLGGTT